MCPHDLLRPSETLEFWTAFGLRISAYSSVSRRTETQDAAAVCACVQKSECSRAFASVSSLGKAVQVADSMNKNRADIRYEYIMH